MNDGQNCTVFGRCGGCSLLDVPYEEQLFFKDSKVRELFEGIADASSIRPIAGMESPYKYRDKVISPFVAGKARDGKSGKRTSGNGRAAKGSKKSGAGNEREILTGMYAKGTHEVIPTGSCLLENEVAQRVVQAIASIMRKHGIEPYDEDSGRGFMRHVVVRVGHESDEVLVTLVTNGDEFPHSKSFCRELVKRVPEVTSVVQNVNTRQTNVVLGDRDRTLYGPGFILDSLCGMSFRISPQSFYQVNSEQTEVLYRTAIELAQLKDGQTVIDAYCGTGTIGLVALKACEGARLIGIDSEASSIRDARQNARHNGMEDAEFVVADATEFLQSLAESSDASDSPVLFMDPPRAGSTPELLEAAASLAPERIVYISCNPVTQVRDIRQLKDAGYEVEAVQPVDMFPHTDHIETVVSLVKVGDVAEAGHAS